MDEHKIDLTIKKKVENYYIREDEYQLITPEQGIVILDKYTTKSKLQNFRNEINETWNKINNKILPLKAQSQKLKEETQKDKWI